MTTQTEGSSGTGRLGSVVSVRFTEDELAQLREKVGDRGVSQFVREAVLGAMAPASTSRPGSSRRPAHWGNVGAENGVQVSGYFNR